MRNAVAVALTLLVTGCIQQFQVQRTYTAEVEVARNSTDALTVSLLTDSIRYAETNVCELQTNTQKTRAWSKNVVPPLLPLRITNVSPSIVTIDWDHSVFVDGNRNSYRLFTSDSDKTPSDIETIKKPPSPVIAPHAHLDVLVFPERRLTSDPIFWAPRAKHEVAEFRVVLAVANAAQPTEAVFRAVVLKVDELRTPPRTGWPREGDECLPGVGCAAGYECGSDNRCRGSGTEKNAGPKTLPAGEVSPFGGKCSVDADCLPGLGCYGGKCKPAPPR